jgi:hypothetical protein
LYQFTRRAIELTVINEEYHYYQLHTKIVSHIFLSRLSPYVGEIIGINSMGFDVTDLGISQILEKNGSTTKQYISSS